MHELQTGNVIESGQRHVARYADASALQLGQGAQRHRVARDEHGRRGVAHQQARHGRAASCDREVGAQRRRLRARVLHRSQVAELALATRAQRRRAADHRDAAVPQPQQVLGDQPGAIPVVRHLGRPALRPRSQGNDGAAIVGDAAGIAAHTPAIVWFVEPTSREDHARHAAQAEHLDITQLGHRVPVTAAHHSQESARRRGSGRTAHDLREVRVADVVDHYRDRRHPPRTQRAGHRIRPVGKARGGGLHTCARSFADRMVTVGVEST